MPDLRVSKQASMSVMMRTARLVLEISPQSEFDTSSEEPAIETTHLADGMGFMRSRSKAGQLSFLGRPTSPPALVTAHLAPAAQAFSRSRSFEVGQLSSRGRRGSLPALHTRCMNYQSLGPIESFLALHESKRLQSIESLLALNEAKPRSRVSKARSRDNRSRPLLARFDVRATVPSLPAAPSVPAPDPPAVL